MIFVSPYVPGLTDYDEYAKALSRNGVQPGHVHLVISLPEHEDGAIEFAALVAELFSHSSHRIVQRPRPANAVAVANALFHGACDFLKGYRPVAGEAPGVPMIYTVPSWRPSKVGWLGQIQAEYYAKQAPRALGRMRDGNLWGPVVISSDFPAQSALLPFLDGTRHWRDYLRHEIGNGMPEAATIGAGRESVLRPPTPKRKR